LRKQYSWVSLYPRKPKILEISKKTVDDQTSPVGLSGLSFFLGSFDAGSKQRTASIRMDKAYGTDLQETESLFSREVAAGGFGPGFGSVGPGTENLDHWFDESSKCSRQAHSHATAPRCGMLLSAGG
jgi:hypothetical protein